MRKRLTADLSRDELLGMRDTGMSNQEIADSLGICVATVRNHIGAMPEEWYETWGRAKNGIRRKTEKAAAPAPAPQPEPEEEAAGLVVQNKKIELHGLLGIYSIDCKSGAVTVGLKDSLFEITQEEVDTLITELKAIRRNSKKLIVTNEIW